MGLFGGNYERAGSGIAKNAPKKKGFFRYFEIFGRKFWKLLGLNLLYFMFFLPLIVSITLIFIYFSQGAQSGLMLILAAFLVVVFAVLFGPATAAHTKILKNFFMEKPTFILHDFFHTLRSEFKYAAVVGILDCVLVCCIAAACYVYPRLIEQTGSKIYYVFFAITLSIGLIVLLMNFYAFLMMISTNLSLKNVLKNSLALAVVALKKNVIVLLIVGVVVALYVVVLLFMDLRYSMILLFLTPFLPASWLGLAVVVECYPIIQKYIINPYYEQRGEINPELIQGTTSEEETVFEDMGGKEKPIEPDKKAKRGSGSNHSEASKGHKGKIIS